MKAQIQKLDKNSLMAAKALDNAVFTGHQQISMHELETIASQSGLLGIFDNNVLVAYAQLLLESTNFYSLENERWAYCYGIGVDQVQRGKGYAKLLIRAMEEIARANSKEALYLASRPENYASLKLWQQLGYHIFDYKPRYFGHDEKADTRLLLKRGFNEPEKSALKFLCKLQLENDLCDMLLRSKIALLLKKHKILHIKIDSHKDKVFFYLYTRRDSGPAENYTTR